MDKLGRGLPMVCQEAKKLEKNVLFEDSGEEFRVTLPWPIKKIMITPLNCNYSFIDGRNMPLLKINKILYC